MSEEIAKGDMDSKTKPCSVHLPRVTFTKIRIKCTATENGSNLKCYLTQEGTNTFSIRLKRKMSDDFDVSKKLGAKLSDNSKQKVKEVVQAAKRRKIDDPTSRLRPRSVKIPKEPSIRKKSTAVAPYKSIPKPVPLKNVKINEIVLCKMKGFCEWPGLVTGFDKKLVVVTFFGDKTTHKAAVHNFFSFKDSYELIAHNLRTRKTPLFAKSIKEAEIYLGIPDCNSILI